MQLRNFARVHKITSLTACLAPDLCCGAVDSLYEPFAQRKRACQALQRTLQAALTVVRCFAPPAHALSGEAGREVPASPDVRAAADHWSMSACQHTISRQATITCGVFQKQVQGY